MILGILAAASGIVYAVAKFLTALRVRRLREALVRAQNDLQKAQQLLDVLNGKQKVEHSKRKSVSKDVERLRLANEELYTRLRTELPAQYLPSLDDCMRQNAADDQAQLRVLNELKLAEKISEVLNSLSLLVVEFIADDESDRTVALGQFARSLDKERTTYHATDQSTIVCTFDAPAQALELLRDFKLETPSGRKIAIRGGLYTGVQLTGEAADLNRFLAQHLQLARKLSGRAPANVVLLNEGAFQNLDSPDDIDVFDQTSLLYSYRIPQPKVEPAS